jgi:hypothetical protein
MTTYEFLRDQGSFIAGILTLVGGGLAYFAQLCTRRGSRRTTRPGSPVATCLIKPVGATALH